MVELHDLDEIRDLDEIVRDILQRVAVRASAELEPHTREVLRRQKVELETAYVALEEQLDSVLARDIVIDRLRLRELVRELSVLRAAFVANADLGEESRIINRTIDLVQDVVVGKLEARGGGSQEWS